LVVATRAPNMSASKANGIVRFWF